MFALLVLLFILMPIAEIYVIIQVGQAIGAWWTIALLVADSIVGAQILRWQGRKVWRSFKEALAANRMPHREILDGAFVIIGGTLLLTPGFITDVFGLLLLIPPTRSLARRVTIRFFTPTTMARVTFVRANPQRRTAQAPPRHFDQPPPPRLPRG